MTDRPTRCLTRRKRQRASQRQELVKGYARSLFSEADPVGVTDPSQMRVNELIRAPKSHATSAMVAERNQILIPSDPHHQSVFSGVTRSPRPRLDNTDQMPATQNRPCRVVSCNGSSTNTEKKDSPGPIRAGKECDLGTAHVQQLKEKQRRSEATKDFKEFRKQEQKSGRPRILCTNPYLSNNSSSDSSSL